MKKIAIVLLLLLLAGLPACASPALSGGIWCNTDFHRQDGELLSVCFSADGSAELTVWDGLTGEAVEKRAHWRREQADTVILFGYAPAEDAVIKARRRGEKLEIFVYNAKPLGDNRICLTRQL